MLVCLGMNPASASEPVPRPAPAQPARVIIPVPPEPGPVTSMLTQAPEPACYREGRDIVLENGASLPPEFCIRCGRTPSVERSFAVRRPGDPRTWFGRRPALTMALCRRHAEDHSVASALTWSVLAIGVLLVSVGAITWSPVTVVLGFVAACLSGWFRATSPVSALETSETRIVLRGAGKDYLRYLPDPPKEETGS